MGGDRIAWVTMQKSPLNVSVGSSAIRVICRQWMSGSAPFPANNLANMPM